MTDDTPITFAKKKKKVKRAARNQPHDIFKRIDMQGGDKDKCWEWQGKFHVGNGGEHRGVLTVGGVRKYAHRLAWELYNGRPLEPKEVVRHKCDNTKCCNPFHLIVGTQKDNVQDMLQRERTGHKHADVKKIMQLLEIGCTSEYITEYMKRERGVEIDASTVRRIKRRRYYRHIEWEWGDAWALKKGYLLASDFDNGKLLPYAETQRSDDDGNTNASQNPADTGQAQ